MAISWPGVEGGRLEPAHASVTGKTRLDYKVTFRLLRDAAHLPDGAHPLPHSILGLQTRIVLDGQTYWRDGRFVFLERADVRALLETYPGFESAFEYRTDVGIRGTPDAASRLRPG